jgi:hypothetical protein
MVDNLQRGKRLVKSALIPKILMPRPYLAFSASGLWSTISDLPRYMVITP